MMDWEQFNSIVKRLEKNDATLTALDFDIAFLPDREALSLGGSQVRILSNALEHNTRVKSLRIANHAIGDNGLPFISEMLCVNRSITSLILDNVDIGYLSFSDIFYAMRQNQIVQELTIRVANLDSKFLKYEQGLVRASLRCWLRENRSIKKVTLSNIKIDNQSFLTHDGFLESLSEGLGINKVLEELTLEDEKGFFPSRYGLAVLAECVPSNKTLYALNIPYDANDQVSYRSIREINATLTNNHTAYLLAREPKQTRLQYAGSFFSSAVSGVSHVMEQARKTLF